ncbi:integrase core domain-containing protein [Gulosibacter chungangensis]|uniref:integrase core domain-containing protein n=1 Tax=Gulosibacter chungangensis TaxID=979746 RepID=UPI00298EC655|nr:integrase core domain-containing protein [Gulosibacter chungangensis]
MDCHEWGGLIEVMAATSEWVGWYNQRRLHSGIDYLTPAEAHDLHQPMALAA